MRRRSVLPLHNVVRRQRLHVHPVLCPVPPTPPTVPPLSAAVHGCSKAPSSCLGSVTSVPSQSRRPAAAPPLPVVVVGGGIAGLTVARALSVAGLPVRVFEAADRDDHPAAAGETCVGDRRALRNLGVDGTLPHSLLTAPHFSPSACVTFSTAVTGFTSPPSSSDPVVVHLSDGSSVSASCLIGADGVDSTVRTHMNLSSTSHQWVGDRVVLLGDAAHGLKDRLAIQDAMELAHRLHSASDLSDAAAVNKSLQQYQTSRRPHAAANRACTAATGVVGRLRGPLVWLRFMAPNFQGLLAAVLGSRYTPPSLGRPLYERAMGKTAFGALPPILRRFHATGGRCQGRVRVSHGSLLASVVAWVGGLPRAMNDGVLTLSVSMDDRTGVETWRRVFDESDTSGPVPASDGLCPAATRRSGVFTTLQCLSGDMMAEASGPLVFWFHLKPVPDKGFDHCLQQVSLRLPFVSPSTAALPLPRVLWPRVDATTRATLDPRDGWRFRVTVRAPPVLSLVLDHICTYEGSVDQFWWK